MSNNTDEEERIERRYNAATKSSQFITNTLVGILTTIISVAGVLAWDVKKEQDARIESIRQEMLQNLRAISEKADMVSHILAPYQIEMENRVTRLESQTMRLRKDCDKKS